MPKSKPKPPRTDSSQERTVLLEHEQLDAYSIALFCARHGISERFYFKLKAAGRDAARQSRADLPRSRRPLARRARGRERAALSDIRMSAHIGQPSMRPRRRLPMLFSSSGRSRR
jgi:hypothetical protein